MSQSESKTEIRGGCDRREEILEAATRLFAEHGYSDAVTQHLADTLGVGKGTLYRHFPSKRELFLAATDRVMRKLHDCIEQSAHGISDGLERLPIVVRSFLDFFSEHPEYLELLMQERAQFKDREKPTYLVHRERNVERWRDRYRSLISDGRVRSIPVERITDVLTATLYGAMFLSYVSGKSEAFALSAEDILDVFQFGILSEPERRAKSPAPPRKRNGQAASAGSAAGKKG